MTTEWFRKSTWSSADQEEFEAKLKRARPYNRAQYLSLQAGHLARSESALFAEAISLLDRAIADYPEDILLAAAHAQRAEIHCRLGDLSRAVEDYRSAFDVERKRPNVESGAWQAFGLMVVEHGLSEVYDECLEVLGEFATDLPFPVQRYRYHAIRALIAASRLEQDKATTEAARALEAAAATDSGFRYHSDLGLVDPEKSTIHDRLLELAAG